jgi:hypothetical protein
MDILKYSSINKIKVQIKCLQLIPDSIILEKFTKVTNKIKVIEVSTISLNIL